MAAAPVKPGMDGEVWFEEEVLLYDGADGMVLLWRAGQSVTSGAQEVIVTMSVEVATSVSTTVTAAEAIPATARMAEMENCIVKRVYWLRVVKRECFGERKEEGTGQLYREQPVRAAQQTRETQRRVKVRRRHS